MAKRGRKQKIDAKATAAIFAVLTVGASLQDAADYVGISRDTLSRKQRNDANFRKGVDRAQARGKVHLIQRVARSTAWRAAAWMLERKYSKEFGRKIDLTTDGKPVNFTLNLGDAAEAADDDE